MKINNNSILTENGYLSSDSIALLAQYLKKDQYDRMSDSFYEALENSIGKPMHLINVTDVMFRLYHMYCEGCGGCAYWYKRKNNNDDDDFDLKPFNNTLPKLDELKVSTIEGMIDVPLQRYEIFKILEKFISDTKLMIMSNANFEKFKIYQSKYSEIFEALQEKKDELTIFLIHNTVAYCSIK